LHVLNRLRTLSATVGAIAVGAVRMATSRPERATELHAGDRAPEFSLQGSDGRVHSLREFAGRSTVVIAWFPKAFTGG
jgi:peroxiredoxin Q/BCP